MTDTFRSAFRFARRVIPALALSSAALAVASGCAQSSPAASAQAAPPAVPATVMRVSQRSMPTTIDAVGRAEGSKEVEVRARVSGIVAKQVYSEGSAVKEGELLFQIERAPFEIALAHATAALAQEQAKNEQAQRDVVRAKELVAKKLISEKNAEDAETALRASNAAVLAAEAKVREARLNLSYTRVSAPIAGITGRAQKSEGSLVTAGTDSSLLTTLVQTDPIWVRFALSEAEHDRLRRAMRGAGPDAVVVTLNVPGADEKPLRGRLNFAGSTVDSRIGTVQLRAEFANPDLALLPGQYVDVHLAAGAQPTITVPKTSVLDGNDGKFVWVLTEDGKAAQRVVRTGSWVGNDWVINEGLKPGDVVIVDNLLKLRPGVAVQPLGVEGAQSAAAMQSVGAQSPNDIRPSGTVRSADAHGNAAATGTVAASNVR